MIWRLVAMLGIWVGVISAQSRLWLIWEGALDRGIKANRRFEELVDCGLYLSYLSNLEMAAAYLSRLEPEHQMNWQEAKGRAEAELRQAFPDRNCQDRPLTIYQQWNPRLPKDRPNQAFRFVGEWNEFDLLRPNGVGLDSESNPDLADGQKISGSILYEASYEAQRWWTRKSTEN